MSNNLLPVLTGLFLAGCGYLDKIAIAKFGITVWQATILRFSAALATILLLNLLTGQAFKLPTHKFGAVIILISGIAQAGAIYFLYSSLQHLESGQTIIIWCTTTIIFGLLLSVLFLHEELTLIKACGTLSCIVGILLVLHKG
jgi:drug/metabolite transporter (DMT)-like permease